MPVKVAINGFGRIGRAAFKIAMERKGEIEVVPIYEEGGNVVYKNGQRKN